MTSSSRKRKGAESASWRRLRLGAILLAALGLLGAAVGYARARFQRTREEAAVLQSTVRPEKRRVDASVLATGTIRLKVGAQVRVGAQISGTVRQLRVGVGSRVRKGDIIAEIDTRSVAARVAQVEAQVRQDSVELQKARRDLERGSNLLGDGLIPNQQVEDLSWAVRSAEAKLEKSRADLAAAQVDLGNATIRAPISGTVASVATQEGETVAASFATPTFVTIVETRALELVAVVDEVDIGGVKPGSAASFTVEAFPSEELAGTVQRISPTATIVSGVVNYEVVIAIAEIQDFLKPDMTASVAIRTAQRAALTIPDSAIHSEGDERFVFVVEGGQVRKRAVSAGARIGLFTEIRRGLNEGDRVVVGNAVPGKGRSS